MKKPSEFATRAQAQAYTVIKERMISHDMIVAFLTQHDCVTTLEASTDEKAKGFYLAVRSGVKEFNVMNSHPVGQSQQLLLDHLVSVSAVNQGFADSCINYANYVEQPHENLTQAEFDYAQPEIVALSQNNAKHYLNLNIANDALSPVTIEVQQRFGPDDSDLTEWHRVSQFSPQVKYKQMTYQGVVSPAPAAYRELRVVSPVTLGITVSNA